MLSHTKHQRTGIHTIETITQQNVFVCFVLTLAIVSVFLNKSSALLLLLLLNWLLVNSVQRLPLHLKYTYIIWTFCFCDMPMILLVTCHYILVTYISHTTKQWRFRNKMEMLAMIFS